MHECDGCMGPASLHDAACGLHGLGMPYLIYKSTSLLVAALLAAYIIVHYATESTRMYKLSPCGAERQKRINSVEKVQCNYIQYIRYRTLLVGHYMCVAEHAASVSYIQLCHCRAWYQFTWLCIWPSCQPRVLNSYYTYTCCHRLTNAVPFDAGALSLFRAVQATQANLYFPNRSTLMSNCKLNTMRNSCISNHCAPLVQ